MEPRLVVDILLTIVNAHKYSDSQKYEILGRFSSALLSSATPVAGANLTPRATTQAAPETPKPVSSGPVIIPKGTTCTCEACKKPVYQVVNDVLETMTVNEFVAAFAPVNGAAAMTRDTDMWGDLYGNIAVDCPLCKGRFTVWIKGKGEKLFGEYPENTQQAG